MVSRSMSLLARLSRLSVRLAFLAAAIAYATFSILSDLEYAIGLKTMDLRRFVLAAQIFPLMRTHRSGAAYAVILAMEPKGIPLVEAAIVHDVNAADLWYGLARLRLREGNELGYNSALTRLKELTPGMEFSLVKLGD